MNKTMRERLFIFDTTLRDGAQSLGVTFSLADKLLIAKTLDELGVDYVEGGYPGANPTDTAFFAQKHLLPRARITAFGMTKRAGRSVSNDPGFADLLTAEADAVCLVAKSWDYHVEVALGVSQEENLDAIADSVRAVREAGRESLIDCEHFFDGYKANPAYALACAKTAYEAGARWVVLCDTNGGTLPMRWQISSRRWREPYRAIISASTLITTPRTPWPTPSRRSRRACARSRAR